MKTTQIFKTITIGGKSKEDLLKNLQISDYVKEMLDKVKFSKKEREVRFAKITPRELGINTYISFSKFCEKLKEKGYDLCQPEDVLYLRASYLEQPFYEWVYIAMKTIADSNGNPRFFALFHSGNGLWVDSDWYDPTYELNPVSLWLVRLRKDFEFKTLESSDFDNLILDLKDLIKKYESNPQQE